MWSGKVANCSARAVGTAFTSIPKTTKPPPFPGTERSTKYLAKKICRDLGIAEP
jgi:hypothetical protein